MRERRPTTIIGGDLLATQTIRGEATSFAAGWTRARAWPGRRIAVVGDRIVLEGEGTTTVAIGPAHMAMKVAFAPSSPPDADELGALVRSQGLVPADGPVVYVSHGDDDAVTYVPFAVPAPSSRCWSQRRRRHRR